MSGRVQGRGGGRVHKIRHQEEVTRVRDWMHCRIFVWCRGGGGVWVGVGVTETLE